MSQDKALKEHLLMMLEAMQYTGKTKHKNNDELRELVEEQKLVFLRKLQQAQDADNGRLTQIT